MSEAPARGVASVIKGRGPEGQASMAPESIARLNPPPAPFTRGCVPARQVAQGTLCPHPGTRRGKRGPARGACSPDAG